MIHIILIRHGRTAWNTAQGQRFRGLVDLPLAPEGEGQARATARRLATDPLTAVYTSPLQRAAHTAEAIAATHDLPLQKSPGLTSMNYGHWAGHLHSQVAQRWPEQYRQWRLDPFRTQVPGGEHPETVRKRAIATLHQILAQQRDGDTVALVTHQMITKILICALVGLPDEGFWWIRQDLCNLTRFDYSPQSQTFDLVGLNDTCHLEQTLPKRVDDGTRLLLVRHAQTAWNAAAGEERFRGRFDLPLDATGELQARAVSDRLAVEPIAAIYASPLLRARLTLHPLARRLGLPIQTHPGLLDIDYGHLEGLSRSDAAQVYPELYRLWGTSPSQVRFPGGEGLQDVQGRLQSLLDELLDRHPGQTIALVGHQIVNKVLIATLFRLSLDAIWRIGQHTTAINVFQRAADTWRTLCLNDVCHRSSAK